MGDDTIREMVERYGVGDLLHHAVLIVDDDAPNLAVLSAVLESDYTVLEAGSGDEALDLLESHKVDVVVTDQRMPGMTGVELLERISSFAPDVAGIVLTAYTDAPAMMSAINRARVFRFLTKPWEAQQVLAAVEQASRHVYQRRAIEQLVSMLARRNEELLAATEALKASQQQMLHLERLSTMGRLAAGVAHDLRNFLNGLMVLEEEVRTREAYAELREAVAVSMAGLRNLLGTLETVNRFCGLKDLVVRLVSCAPEGIVQDALTVMRLDSEFRRRKVDVRVSSPLPRVQADRERLVQVMVNLLRNAVQATAQGQRIVVEATSREGGQVVFAVEDEGVGVPAELKERLFEPFVSSKGDQGMGMGLYMARLVVDAHGGRITCQDREGGGARFEVVLGGTSS